jgi:hypothetical protein
MTDESVPHANAGRAVPGTGEVVARSAEAVSRSGEAVPRGELRASHEDRDRVVELLRVSAGDGRLTAEELDERVEAALTARTYNELAALVADLPTASGAAVSMPAARPREVARIDCTHGNTSRQGHWAVPRRLEVRVKHGNVTLDFTDAEITSPTLQIDADIVHGNLTLLTRPGIVVNTDDLAIHGGSVKADPVPSAGVPVMLRIDVSGDVRYSNIRANSPRPPKRPRGPRRTFWQWLTRQGRHSRRRG